MDGRCQLDGRTILAALMSRSLMPAALRAAIVLSRLRAVGLSALNLPLSTCRSCRLRE